MSVAPIALKRTVGFVVADAAGRVVGRVECPMYGRTPDEPDALAVKSGFLARRRRMIPADAIEQIDGRKGVVGLNVTRDAIKSFL